MTTGTITYTPTVAGSFTYGTQTGGSGVLNSKSIILTSSSATATTIPAGSTISGTGIASGTVVTSTVAISSGTPGTVLLSTAMTAIGSGTYTFAAQAPVGAFGAGGLPNGETIYITGTNFAADGAAPTITSSNPDLSITGTELSSTLIQATLSTTAATTSGYASITVKDNNGTSASLANALLVNPDPTITSISPTSVAATQTAAVTLSGTGIQVASGSTLTFKSTVDGTTLAVANVISATASTVTANVTGNNSFNGAPATAGSYTVTYTNLDGGSVTTGPIFAVASAGITNVSPSTIPASTTTNTSVTITGAGGFQPNAVVTFTGCAANTPIVAANSTVVVSATTITATLSATTNVTTALCNVVVTNPTIGGVNGAVYTAPGALGVGIAANASATIASATLTPNTPIVAGSTGTTPVTLSLTGTGFSSASTVQFVYGATDSVDGAVTGSCTAATTGTTMTCAISVGSGAFAGVHGVQVVTGTGTSNVMANALTVAGPAITSASPSTVAKNANVGTVITLTGSGLNSTATLFTSGTLTGTFAVTSPTTATFALTTSPSATGTTYLTITEYVAAGVQVKSQPFALTVSATPTVTSSYQASLATPGTSAYLGAGAVNVPVIITGTDFQAGATVGTFVNAYGAADPGVTATVKSVNTAGTAITALVSIAAGDANLSVGYTVTNPDGGYVKVAGFAPVASIFIAAGPTITSVSPATVTANSTDAFTITGTGFVGSSVSPTANGTCGPTTVVSSTSLTVTCTFSAATATAVSLVVVNADGGQATSAVVLAAATPVTPPVKPAVNLHTTGSHGYAVVGRTVMLRITGGGFYGQPKLTSTAPGVRAIVTKDNGTMLTVQVTTTSVRARGWHTFTIRLANGKMAKVNYLTK
ncbi:MAG: beta strand repeat-containing protein [Acidimicrobiales bacterium]